MSQPALKVGLEIHVPLATASKLHCPCPVDPDAAPNSRICPTCTGQPGAKPQGVNRTALERTVRAAQALGCRVEAHCIMQRKHYVYPDLPNNYQRTSTPVGSDGRFEDVGILEIHVEEDPGAFDPEARTVDFNRCGGPLAEVVTAPDLASADDAVRFLRTLRLSLEANGVLRPGADFKADVNVSVGDGPRVEVKNVTGARNAGRAIETEAARQRRLVASGHAVARETRHFDEATGMTRTAREKETVAEYRYIPDPDLPPIDVSAVLAAVAAPVDVPARLRAAEGRFKAGRDEVLAVAEDPPLLQALEALADGEDPAGAFDFVNRVVRGELNFRKRSYGPPLDVPGLRRILQAQAGGAMTRRGATNAVRAWLDGAAFDAAFAGASGVVAGPEVGDVADAVVAANPKAVADYRAGAKGALDFLLGQVMARTKGKADPVAARTALEDRLRSGP